MPQCCPPTGGQPLDPEQASHLARLAKVLADPIRLRLLSIISAGPAEGSCACDLLNDCDISQPTISHHLKTLHTAGLLTREKRGSWVYYSIRRDAVAHFASAFNTL